MSSLGNYSEPELNVITTVCTNTHPDDDGKESDGSTRKSLTCYNINRLFHSDSCSWSSISCSGSVEKTTVQCGVCLISVNQGSLQPGNVKDVEIPAPTRHIEQDSSEPKSNSICRICLDECGEEGFISPCACTGTMARVHKSCLERWLSALDSSECDICKNKLSVERVYPPIQQVNSPPLDVCTDLLFIVFVCPLCLLILFMIGQTFTTCFKEGNTIGIIAMMIAGIAVATIYVCWIVRTLKVIIEFWCRSNRIVRVHPSIPTSANNNNHGVV